MKCKIADFNIELHPKGKYLAGLCKKFISEFDVPDFTVDLSDKEIFAEQAAGSSLLYAEAVAACRKLALMLPKKDAFLLHGATFELENRGICFLAKSGTGKSTHMLLWKELFGQELKVVNGDKPIVRFENGVPHAFGTPWCGKEGLCENRGVPLTDICFITRSEQNKTVPLDKGEALGRLMSQIIIPSGSENILKIMTMLDKVAANCRMWEIFCNTDISSARESSGKILEVK